MGSRAQHCRRWPVILLAVLLGVAFIPRACALGGLGSMIGMGGGKGDDEGAPSSEAEEVDDAGNDDAAGSEPDDPVSLVANAPSNENDDSKYRVKRRLYKGTYVNMAKEVTMSSVKGQFLAARAINRVQHGYSDDAKSVAMTRVEDSPWMEVDMGRVVEVQSVELWMPKTKCESIKFLNAKKCDEMTVSARKPLIMYVSRDQASPDEANPKKEFKDQRTVYSWDHVEQHGRYVRIVAPGSGRTLMATEVKVFIEDRDMKLCNERTCMNGDCKCVGAGCKKQKCQCKPDFIGTEDCSVNPLRDWRYLPLKADGPSEPWNVPLWNKLMEELKEIQRPSSCSRPTIVHHLIGAGARGAGLGSTLHFITGYLGEAYKAKKPFAFSGKFNYAGTQYCKSKGLLGDFDCYFEPFAGGGCTAAKNAAKKAYRPPRINPRAPNRCPIGRRCNDVSTFKYIPKKFEKQGLFWWRTAMSGYLIKANRQAMAMLKLKELKQRIGFVNPIIGVHVRHGDACHTTDRRGRCKGIAHYIPEIRVMSEKYGTKRVYLATDDASVVRQTRRFSDEFKFVFAEFDRGVFASKEQIEYRKNLWSGANNKGHQIMLTSLIDLFLLADSDYLIVHFLSNMSRLAIELAAARKLRVPPYISMDGPWCHHWRMCLN